MHSGLCAIHDAKGFENLCDISRRGDGREVEVGKKEQIIVRATVTSVMRRIDARPL